MFTKLFAMYPMSRTQDVDLTLRAYIDETRRVPALVISHALARLTARPEKFAPSVGEILADSARIIRRIKLEAEGRDSREYNLRGDFKLDVEGWLKRAPEVIHLIEAPRKLELLAGGKS
jgi:hypothetical protein